MVIIIAPLLKQLVNLFIFIIRVGQRSGKGQGLPGEYLIWKVIGNDRFFNGDGGEIRYLFPVNLNVILMGAGVPGRLANSNIFRAPFIVPKYIT